MLEVVSWFVLYYTMHFLDCYVFSKFIKEKFRLSINVVIVVLLFSILDCVIGINSSEILKITITNLLTFVILKIIYNKSISKTLLGTLFIYLGYAVAEITFAVIFIQVFKISEDFLMNNTLGYIFTNICMYIAYFIIFSITPIIDFISKILIWYDEKKLLKTIISLLLTIFLFYIFIFQISYDKVNNINELLIVLIILLGIFVFVGGYFNEKSNNNKLTIEYTQLLEYVKDYEKEVVEKGKRQHEYKNQLIVINDMIPKTNKKLKKYVEDKLEIEKNIKDNVWLEKLTNLPSGGIKGLVYYKLKQMIEKNIEVYVEVDNELSDKKKWFNIEKYLEDYTRILGVYLDNAIEAANESKDKQIIIEFKENNDNIEFILSNTYVGKINYDSIDKEKFSTKGKGRGYGLSLVKDIIEKNKLLSQSREINGKFYVQKLTIKK